MTNKYKICGDVTTIYLHRKDGTTLETFIDTADFEKANAFQGRWISKRDDDINGFYVVGAQHGPLLHRWITDAKKGYVVDHINHNTLDNRRSVNLKVCSETKNQLNRKGAQKNSKSQVRGVFRKNNKWYATITFHGRPFYLGSFEDITLAERLEKAAVRMVQRLQKVYEQEADHE